VFRKQRQKSLKKPDQISEIRLWLTGDWRGAMSQAEACSAQAEIHSSQRWRGLETYQALFPAPTGRI
jgi:hypothetical protein